MSAPHETQAAHPTALLLPWYVSGTLKDQEHLAVEHHLADFRVPVGARWRNSKPCGSRCRMPLPQHRPPRLQNRGDGQDPERPGRSSTSNSQPAALPVGETLEQWFRNLFAPRWMPTLAATLLIGQLLLLL
ncbi:MAG: hypothetical protein U0231_01195 [Nitrospiraceae bacterium]